MGLVSRFERFRLGREKRGRTVLAGPAAGRPWLPGGLGMLIYVYNIKHMFIYIHKYMYVCIYIYIYIHTHLHSERCI